MRKTTRKPLRTAGPVLRRVTVCASIGVGLSVGLGPVAGTGAVAAATPVLTLGDSESVERVVLASGEELRPGCFDPGQFALEPIPRRAAGGVATAWNVGDAALLGLRNGASGAVRYGIPLHDGRLETLPDEGVDAAALGSGSPSLTVLDAATGLPLEDADLLLRAAGGRVCWLRTDAQGVAAISEAVSFADVVAAADGFVGGHVPLPANGRLLLRRARSIAVHIAAAKEATADDLAVLAFPEWRHRDSSDRPLAVAAAGGAGIVQLRGIPDWSHRVLVAAFSRGVPFGMSAFRLDAGDAVAIHAGSGSVTAAPPADDAFSAIDTVRIERLYEGTELADFAFGPLSERLEFKLRRTDSGLARDDLLAYAWYSVVGAEDSPHFYLDAGERKNLGDLAVPNLLMLVIEGLAPTQGWATYYCRGKERDREGRTLITGSGTFGLWLPRSCEGADGDVRVPDWPTLSFRWRDTDDRLIKIRMRRAGVIRGSVRVPNGRPLANVAVSATWLYPLELEEAADPADLEELIEKYPIFLNPDQQRDHGAFTHLEDDVTAYTAADGSFFLYVPFNGEYRVEATRADYYAPSTTVALDSGPVEIEMRTAASLVGVIRNARGQPVEASLQWKQSGHDAGEAAWTYANAQGAFSFIAPPGRTEVTVSVAGGEPEVREYDLEPGPNEVEIRLVNPLVRIEGVVVAPSDDIVAKVEWVRAQPDRLYYCPSVGLSAEVAVDGRFFFENMSPGVVKLMAETDSHASRTVELVIEPTDTVRQVTLELLGKSGRITGRIESPVSLAGAKISASAGLNYSHAPISASGEFDLSGLPVGDWSLSIYHYGPAQGQDTYLDVAAVDLPYEGDFRHIRVDLTALPTLTLHGGPHGGRVNGAGGVKLDANGEGILRVPKAGIYQLNWNVGDHTFYKKVTIDGDATLDLADPPDRTERMPRYQC